MLEFTGGILPLMDQEMAALLQRLLEKQGLKFIFNAAADGGAGRRTARSRSAARAGDKTETATARQVPGLHRPLARTPTGWAWSRSA